MGITHKEIHDEEIKIDLEPNKEYFVEVASGLANGRVTRHNLGVMLGKDVEKKLKQLDNKREIRVFELSTVVSCI